MKNSNTGTLLYIMILAAGVGWALAALATGAVTSGIIQLLVYGGLLLLFWHENVDPLWGPWTRKAVARRLDEAFQAHLKAKNELAVSEARASQIDAYDRAAVDEHRAWREKYIKNNIPKESLE